MILGMTTQTFTVVHTALSLIGIVSGFVVMYGLLQRKAPRPLDRALSVDHRADQCDARQLNSVRRSTEKDEVQNEEPA